MQSFYAQEKSKGPCTLSSIFLYAFFGLKILIKLYSSSFPNKMTATDAKTQKIEPDPIFFFFLMTDKCFWGSV